MTQIQAFAAAMVAVSVAIILAAIFQTAAVIVCVIVLAYFLGPQSIRDSVAQKLAEFDEYRRAKRGKHVA